MSAEKVEILRIATRQVDLVEFCQASETLQNGPIFSRLQSGQQQQLLSGGRAAAFSAGQVILELGRRAQRLALVLIGSVSLQSDPCCDLALVGTGEIFGLEAVYPDSPCLGARAREETKLAWLDPEAVRKVLSLAPALDEYLKSLARSWQQQARESADFLGRW